MAAPRQNDMKESITVLATTTRVVVDPFADDKKPPLPGSPGGDEFIETLCKFLRFLYTQVWLTAATG
jgi:hypothetical protein